MPKESEAYGGESDQNIITSLGSLYSYRAQQALKQGDEGKAEDWSEAAARQFVGARYGFYPNVHAYHAHAFMHYTLAKIAARDAEKLEHYNSALDVLELGKDNTNPESQQVLYELETTVWLELENNQKIDSLIEELKPRFNSPRGYIIRIRLLIHQAEARSSDQKFYDEKLQEAYEVVKECLIKFPRDLESERLKVKIYSKLFPNDLVGYYTALKEWKLTDTQVNFEYLYRLGVCAFLLGYYDNSDQYFKDLEKLTIGHHLRTRPRDIIKGPDEREKDFEGQVSQIGPEPSRGYIQCTSLPNLRYRLSFSTQVQRFSPSKDQYVKFHIGFNYRGPSAMALRLL